MENAFRVPRRSLAALIVLGAASLVLTTTVNRLAGSALQDYAPRFAWMADATVPSFLAALVIYILVRPRRLLARPVPETDWIAVRRLATRWLAVWYLGLVVAATVAGHWIQYTHGAANLVGFALIAPIAEEMYFRGALFELVERVRPRSTVAPLLVSTLCFSLQHLQFYAFHLTGRALGQVAFAIPMGLVFGSLRARSESIWPAAVVHILTNLPSAFGTGH